MFCSILYILAGHRGSMLFQTQPYSPYRDWSVSCCWLMIWLVELKDTKFSFAGVASPWKRRWVFFLVVVHVIFQQLHPKSHTYPLYSRQECEKMMSDSIVFIKHLNTFGVIPKWHPMDTLLFHEGMREDVNGSWHNRLLLGHMTNVIHSYYIEHTFKGLPTRRVCDFRRSQCFWCKTAWPTCYDLRVTKQWFRIVGYSGIVLIFMWRLKPVSKPVPKSA